MWGKQVLFDNQFVDYSEAKLPVSSFSLHYGNAIIDGIKVVNKKIAFFEEHMMRFANTIKELHCVAVDLAKLSHQITELLEINGFEDAYIRPICWKEQSELKLYSSDNSIKIAVMMRKSSEKLRTAKAKRGLDVCIAKQPKVYGNYPWDKYKLAANYFFAQNLSVKGYDSIILRDKNRFLKEGATTNILFIKKNKIIVPKNEGMFLGITYRKILEIAKENNIEVCIKDMRIEDNIDAMMMLGTSLGVCGVKSIDSKFLLNHKHEIITFMQEQYETLLLQ